MMRRINPTPFVVKGPPSEAGPAPILQWIKIAELVIDDSYQRPIRERGSRTIRKIVADFRWSHFSPLIVAPVQGGFFAIIDGQHRATAAAARGFDSVPCQIVQEPMAGQAAAFAAVNGAVTQMTPMQIFHARVAAGEPAAALLARVCAAASVVILRYPVAEQYLKAGETLAPKVLETCLEKFGADTLTTALQCITETSNNAPGMIRASLVRGLCEALDVLPEWRDSGEHLLSAMDHFDLEDLWDRLRGGGKIADAVRQAVLKYLQARPAPTSRRAA